jgi:hypothetical protein
MHSKTLLKALSLLLACSILFTSCSSTTMLQSTPPGADVYINQQKMGVTPYSYTDSKIVGSSTSILLKKPGYKDFNTVLERTEQADVGAIIGGIFVLVPFLWVCKYNPVHNYTLDPANGDQSQPAIQLKKVRCFTETKDYSFISLPLETKLPSIFIIRYK